MPILKAIDIWELDAWPLAARIVAAGQASWTIVATEPGQEDVLAADVAAELAGLLNVAVTVYRVQNAKDLLHEDSPSAAGPAVFVPGDEFDQHEWRRVDILRSRLERTSPAILVLCRDKLALMIKSAPNFWSWHSANIYRVPIRVP